MKFHLSDAEATATLAEQLNTVLPADTAGWVLLLDGELGAGKSTFARALIRAMGHRGAVPSPTYTLIEPYELPGRIVYHVDLYRVSDEEELRFLGWSEIDDGLRIVEPQPGNIAFFRCSHERRRARSEFSALSARGEELLARLDHDAVTKQQD